MVIRADDVPLRFCGGLIIEAEPVYFPSIRQRVEPALARDQKLEILNGLLDVPEPVPEGEA